MPSQNDSRGAFYAELHCLSNFTFLRGASHPQELVARALELGYSAIAITDECSLSGVARAHLAARDKIKLIVGSEFTLDDGTRFVLLATSRASYGRLSHLISMARCAAEKGRYLLSREMLQQYFPKGCIALWSPVRSAGKFDDEPLRWLQRCFGEALWIAVELLLEGDDRETLQQLQAMGEQHGVPLCASGDVHMHVRKRRVLQDVVTAIRLGTSVDRLGYRKHKNGERHLRSREQLQAIYPQVLLDETLRIAERCHFSLDVLREEYRYPREVVPPGYTPRSWLRELTERGIAERWPDGISDKNRSVVERELALIAELQYESYFLTVYDIVKFAREQEILCQGRGSAANSIVCFCLGITNVHPDCTQLLFERFVSRERAEPPDIDVDFEHERREEVIQYIYNKYGHERTALAATVITYRTRSAIRDVGKALGMSQEQIDHLAKSITWWDQRVEDKLEAGGLALDSFVIRQFVYLVGVIIGFPRHLSQHVGGFVISEGKLTELVPIENAAMADRRVIQWEKDDLEALGLMKVDVLALGMLTAIRKALKLIGDFDDTEPMALTDIPREDPSVYEMICRADTVGVFQIESRAQMSMLPRLRPENYYDLVIEIAIMRPGPIQGHMVHPYLARRNGREPVTYPCEKVKRVLERTLGVPIFQEQVMQFAMIAADYTAGEADQLRRDMAAWKRKGGLEPHREKLYAGMKTNGYSDEYFLRIFEQIKGFGDYGFPESHSASFAHLAYISSWLKNYYPAAFCCALINSWPMGFYRPDQLVQDARRHGVVVRPVEINASEWDCTLEKNKAGQAELRLGLRMVKGLSKNAVERLCEVRAQRAFSSVRELMYRTGLSSQEIECIAAADALRELSGHRHSAFWQVSGVEQALPLLREAEADEVKPMLRTPAEVDDVLADYRQTGLTLRRHPLAMLRETLQGYGALNSSDLWKLETDQTALVAGLVVNRQRPGTAAGVVFVTLEDEDGFINTIVWPKIVEKQRQALLQSDLLGVRGKVQKEDGVLHLIADHLEDISYLLSGLEVQSRDFH
ncbi:MAG: error-prone DNA polymerase [Pseudomonadota bacterium]